MDLTALELALRLQFPSGIQASAASLTTRDPTVESA